MSDTQMEAGSQPRIAVLIPCLNEAETIGQVVKDFSSALPRARVYVYDNGSDDQTFDVAQAAGATARREPNRGKGNVVRRMFSDIEADVYVLVDGDGTYAASSAAMMVTRLMEDSLDLISGSRQAIDGNPYRPGHRLGNAALTRLVRYIFHSEFKDMLSGLKVCSRRFVKTFPALSEGFEIETEMTIHALELRMPVGEVDVPYRERQAGSSSKLSTFSDGLLILRAIGDLVKDEKPLPFFGGVCIVLGLVSVVLGIPIVQEYLATGLVPRFPTAILASALMILAFLSLTCGVILDSVTRGRREVKRLAYLTYNSPSVHGSIR